jgi:hypothetical protein
VEYLIFTKSRRDWPVNVQPVVEGMKLNHIQGRYWLTDGRRKMNAKAEIVGAKASAVAAKNIDVLQNRLKAYEMYAAKLEKRCKDLTFLAILFLCTTLSLLAFVGLKGI